MQKRHRLNFRCGKNTAAVFNQLRTQRYRTVSVPADNIAEHLLQKFYMIIMQQAHIAVACRKDLFNTAAQRKTLVFADKFFIAVYRQHHRRLF